jgi:hypothetical protein
MGMSAAQAALAVDRAAGLRERLSTALEVLEHGPSGALDERLLDEARRAAASLDLGRLRLARTIGRRVRIAIVLVAAVTAATFIPPLGGPPVASDAASNAAATLQRVAEEGPLAPSVRAEIDRAVARLREPGVSRDGADHATRMISEVAADAARARSALATALAAAPHDAVRRMADAAARGDGAGASAAAADLAEKSSAASASGGLPRAEHERLADSLAGAAPEADRAGLASVGEALRAAADAVRRDPGDGGEAHAAETRATLERLAAALAEALKPDAGGVAAAVQAVSQARRTMGLPEVTPVSEGAGAPQPQGAGAPPAPREGVGETGTTESGAPGEAPDAVPDEVRPEDRDVVRRYFGG